jgi:hypothetical protein
MRHAYGDANGDSHIHANGNCDGNSNCYIHANGDRHSDIYCNSNSNCDSNGYSNCDRIAAAFTDAATSADTAGPSGHLLFREF